VASDATSIPVRWAVVLDHPSSGAPPRASIASWDHVSQHRVVIACSAGSLPTPRCTTDPNAWNAAPVRVNSAVELSAVAAAVLVEIAVGVLVVAKPSVVERANRRPSKLLVAASKT
jgi:hypothetical protein